MASAVARAASCQTVRSRPQGATDSDITGISFVATSAATERATARGLGLDTLAMTTAVTLTVDRTAVGSIKAMLARALARAEIALAKARTVIGTQLLLGLTLGAHIFVGAVANRNTGLQNASTAIQASVLANRTSAVVALPTMLAGALAERAVALAMATTIARAGEDLAGLSRRTSRAVASAGLDIALASSMAAVAAQLLSAASSIVAGFAPALVLVANTVVVAVLRALALLVDGIHGELCPDVSAAGGIAADLAGLSREPFVAAAGGIRLADMANSVLVAVVRTAAVGTGGTSPSGVAHTFALHALAVAAFEVALMINDLAVISLETNSADTDTILAKTVVETGLRASLGGMGLHVLHSRSCIMMRGADWGHMMNIALILVVLAIFALAMLLLLAIMLAIMLAILAMLLVLVMLVMLAILAMLSFLLLLVLRCVRRSGGGMLLMVLLVITVLAMLMRGILLVRLIAGDLSLVLGIAIADGLELLTSLRLAKLVHLLLSGLLVFRKLVSALEVLTTSAASGVMISGLVRVTLALMLLGLVLCGCRGGARSGLSSSSRLGGRGVFAEVLLTSMAAVIGVIPLVGRQSF